MALMDHAPYDFVKNHQEDDLEKLQHFVHRTFNGQDLIQFVKSLRHIYENLGGLEDVFTTNIDKKSIQPAISKFKEAFFEIPHEVRTMKHISDPLKGSAAKRINMYLRWMVRDNKTGVDFGLWKDIPTSILSCPLDVHSGNVARKLDPMDPVKYDFALFGLGVFEKF